MGNKNKGKRETKKKKQKKTKAAPARREDFNQAAFRVVSEATKP
jgi:hypothetical protein